MRFETRVNLTVQRHPQFFIFYVLFPSLFLSCVTFYDWADSTKVGLIVLLGAVSVFKAIVWLRFWKNIQYLCLNEDGTWQLLRAHEAITLDQTVITHIPGIAFIFHFSHGDSSYAYVVLTAQIDAETQRMLTVHVKFLA